MKILIVDDEKPIRQWFRYVIQTNEKYSVVGEAANGKEALQFIKQNEVDLVITDIIMPIMDGLELIQETNQLHLNIQFLILSNFDDFEYVKKGLKLGAADYLLKAETDDEDIIKAIDEIEKTNVTSESSHQQTFNDHYDDYGLCKSFIHDLVHNDVLIHQDDVHRKCLLLKKFISLDRMKLILFSIDHYNQMKQELDRNTYKHIKKELVTTIQGLCKQYFNNGIVFQYEDNVFFLLIGVERKAETYIDETILEMLRIVTKRIFESYRLSFSFGISKAFHNITDLKKVYIEASSSLENKFFKGERSISFYGELPHRSTSNDLFLEVNEMYRRITIKEQDSITTVKKMIHILKRTQIFSPTECKRLFARLLDQNRQIVEELIGQEKNLFKMGNKIDGIEFIDEVEMYVCQEFESMIKQYQSYLYAYSESVNKIIAFIHDHYHERLDLDLIADEIHLNTNYISQLFKKETGLNLNKYILKVRMEQAKKLMLESKMKINEIGRAVGYLNETYFCTSFKKYYGDTPKKYLENIIQKNSYKKF